MHYNANAHIARSKARLDAQTNFSGPASGKASGSVLSGSAVADGNVMLGKGLAASGQLAAEVHLIEVSVDGEVKITPRRVWHGMKCGVETGVKAPFVLFGLTSWPECEEEEGLDDGFGIVIGGGLSGQIGVGVEIGGRVDLGANQRIGISGGAKASFVGGGGGKLSIGVDWSSKGK